MDAPALYVPPTWLDRVVAQVWPRAALRRHFERQLLARAYEAASPRDSWLPRRAGASADADHAADAAMIRAKARSLVQNVPVVRAAMDSLVANVVGTGIRPVFEGSQAEAAAALWKEWVPVADADGVRDFYGLQANAYRTMEQDGEVLVRYRWRRDTDGLPAPLQLQLLEVDWIDVSRSAGGAGSNVIKNGIEYDALGRKVAYWLWDQHPGDVTLRRGSRTQSRRVDAKDVLHLYRAERPGQGRGFSRLAPVISTARDLRLLQDAELARKNLETRLAVLVSGDASLFSAPVSQLTPDLAKATGQLGELPSGSMVQVPPGSNVTTVAPNAAEGFVDHLKYELHLLLAGIGVPYAEGTGDTDGSTFSSERTRQSAYRRQCEQIQWLDFIPGFCNPVMAAFAEAGRMNGRLRQKVPVTADWSTPKWDYVNPREESTAAVTEIGAGIQSISEHIRRRGYEPQKVFAELEEDVKTLKRIGIFDALMFMLKGNSPDAGKPAGAQPAKE